MQQQLAARHHATDERLVTTSHPMMNNRPEVVARAAIELVEKARKR